MDEATSRDRVEVSPAIVNRYAPIVVSKDESEYVEGTLKELASAFPVEVREHGFHRFFGLLRKLGVARRVGIVRGLSKGRPGHVWRIAKWWKIELTNTSEELKCRAITRTQWGIRGEDNPLVEEVLIPVAAINVSTVKGKPLQKGPQVGKVVARGKKAMEPGKPKPTKSSSRMKK
jgi:hypothetical protein